MTPDETDQIFKLITGYWPRVPLTEETIDAWAVALTAIPYETARKAIINHSHESKWPPDVEIIAAAHRQTQRDQRPVDSNVTTINANAAKARREQAEHVRRISQCQKYVGSHQWRQLLDQARHQLIHEYKHEHIPTRLIASRACELAENTKV